MSIKSLQLVLTGFTTHSVVACVDLVLMARCVNMSEATALMVVSQIIRNLCVKVNVMIRVYCYSTDVCHNSSHIPSKFINIEKINTLN